LSDTPHKEINQLEQKVADLRIRIAASRHDLNELRILLQSGTLTTHQERHIIVKMLDGISNNMGAIANLVEMIGITFALCGDMAQVIDSLTRSVDILSDTHGTHP
jgi:hypothetical protein